MACNEAQEPERQRQVVQQSADVVLGALRGLSAEERCAVFALIGEKFCVHCGYPQPDGDRNCRCWDDE